MIQEVTETVEDGSLRIDIVAVDKNGKSAYIIDPAGLKLNQTSI